MKIPYHVKNSDLVNLIKNNLLDSKNLNVIELKNLDYGGYFGEFEIDISADANNFTVPDYNYKDITRFPARIRAAATALKLSNLLGRFRISHDKGILKINKILRNLNLYEAYSREEIHSVFSPDTKFYQGAGTWGNHGIIPIPNRENDFVFIVTYGQSVGEHTFDEGITDEGVLSWQSQPSNKLSDNRIIKLINHDEINDNIYLFLREKKGIDYTYYGRLKYLSHDNEREQPVYFQWQLLDWNLERNKKNVDVPQLENIDYTVGEIELSNDKPVKKTVGTTIDDFRARKAPDYALRDNKNKKLGDLGEELVLRYERQNLISLNRQDLAEKVVHVAKVEGDGAGYDIKSYNVDGSVKYIEVKCTRGNINTDFFMSPREIKFSKINKNNFFLYRVFDLNKNNSGKFYIVKGDVTETFTTQPTAFKLSKK